MKLGKSVIAELLISLLMIAALFYFANIGDVLRVIEGIEFKWLALAFVFYFGINLCMALRIWAILRDLTVGISYPKTLMAHFTGMLASDFTPARSGYLTTAFVLSRNNKIPLEKTMVSILGPQIFDFFLKVTAGAIAFWYLLTYVLHVNAEESILFAVIFGIFALSTMIAVMFLSLFSPRFLKMMSFIKRLPFGKAVHELVENIQQNSHTIRRLFWFILLLLGFTWLLKALEWYCIALAVGFTPDVPFAPIIFFAFLQPLVTILQFAPLPTFAGVGFSEAASVFVLMQFGVAPAPALVFSLLTRFVMIAVDSIGIREAVKMLRLDGSKAKQ
ncbi:Lysylphosphatidylglycerol synthase TM region [Candidatus Burarchaeum australiense]|nr:Lysylphosphatidylglycerol synthase TM region [Candidatus Burarchaeum australiense]